MKTFYIKLGSAHAQVNLTDEEYKELQRLLEEEKSPVDPEKIKELILQAIDNLKE